MAEHDRDAAVRRRDQVRLELALYRDALDAVGGQAAEFDLAERLHAAGTASFHELVADAATNAVIVSRFLAVLELLRLLLVRALQTEEFGEIYLEPTGENLTLDGYEEEYR